MFLFGCCSLHSVLTNCIIYTIIIIPCMHSISTCLMKMLVCSYSTKHSLYSLPISVQRSETRSQESLYFYILYSLEAAIPSNYGPPHTLVHTLLSDKYCYSNYVHVLFQCSCSKITSHTCVMQLSFVGDD